MRARALAFVLLLFALFAGKANAAIVLTWSASGPGDTIITVSASGSGVLTSTANAWDDPGAFGGIVFFNISGNPLNGNLDGDPQFAVISSNLQATNGTSTITADLIQLDDDGGTPGTDEMGLRFSSAPSFSVGNTITFSGSATFDVSSVGATFADFNIGTYSPSFTVRWGSNFALGEFTNGIVIATAVPEPSFGILFGLATLGVAFRRRRSS